jgi:hypothetical protein
MAASLRLDRQMGKLLTATVVYFAAQAAFAHPCSGVDRSLSERQKASFAPVLEKHMRAQFDPRLTTMIAVERDDVQSLFRAQGWYIVYVDNHATDTPYLFYSTDPIRASRYVGVWAGGAAVDEGPEIQAWEEKEMPGIPKVLAKCFAWYVTRGMSE